MKLLRILTILIVLSVTVIAAYFGWRYLFDPRGISIADGEICTTNETDVELVISVETIPGAKIIGLLAKGEKLCAPSPEAKPKGIVMAGPNESELECVFELEGPDKMPFLTAYRGVGDCDWGFVSR